MQKSEPIFKKDSAGKLRVWFYEVDGDKYRTTAGLADGKQTTSKWTVCQPKSQATAEAQAQFEADAELTKKLNREYRRTIDELALVPTSVMLALKYEDEIERVQNCLKNGAGVYSQPKLDGIRSLTRRNGGWSREYQPHLNIDHILKALEPVFAKFPDLEFDGELYNHVLKDDFNTISSIVRKQKPTPEQRAEAERLMQFHIYDMASGGASFENRNRAISILLSEIGLPIVIVPTVHCKTQEELDAMNDQYAEQGYEGQMIRLNGPYEADKRSNLLLKRKVWETAEFPISNIEEGIGNWAGFAKRIEFVLPGDQRTKKGDRPAAGLKGNQKFAAELLAKRADYLKPGALVTIKFKPSPDGIPRFPTAVDFHPEGRKD